MTEGEELLGLFRDEQRKRNHSNYVGCVCSECIEDMDNALKVFNSR